MGYFTHAYQSVCCAHPGEMLDSPLEYIKSQRIFQIKQGIASGNLTPACQQCKDNDDSGTYSTSQSHRELIQDLGIDTTNDPEVDTVPRAIEVRFSNLCNFKCRMCAPDWSSAIAKENLSHPELIQWYCTDLQTRLDSGPKFLSGIMSILPDLRQVYITGGEPTIQKSVLDFLDSMIDAKFSQNIRLNITTNVSAVNPELLNRLEKFSQVSIGLSLDAIDRVAEYQRHGTIWSKIKSNVETFGRFRLENPMRIHLAINSALSAYTVLAVDDLVEYCLDIQQRYRINPWKIFRVDRYLKPTVLVGIFRQRAIDSLGSAGARLEKSKSSLQHSFYQHVYDQLHNLKHQLMTQPPTDRWSDFVKLTRDLDAARNENFAEIFGYELDHPSTLVYQ